MTIMTTPRRMVALVAAAALVAIAAATVAVTVRGPEAGATDTAGTAGTLAWPHFLQVHVQNANAETRIVIDAGWAGVRWASQPGSTSRAPVSNG